MADMLKVDVDTFISIVREQQFAYDRGHLSPQEYWRTFAAKTGARLGPADMERLRSWDVEMRSTLNVQMIQFARQVQAAGLKTAILSNMPHDLAKRLRSWDWPYEFDCLTLSCELKAAKPEAAVYEHCLRSLNVSASEALFLDDNEVNIESARQLAITAVRFSSVAQLRQELHSFNFSVLPATD